MALSRIARARAGGWALGAALVLACASPPIPVHEHPWWEVRSPMFVLRGNAEREEIERLAEDLSRFVEVVRAVADFPIEPDRTPPRIYLLRNAKPILGHWIAGVHVEGVDRGNLVVLDQFHSRSFTRHVLYHEYVHELVSRGASFYPLWYNEGLAELLSTTHVRSGLVTVGLPADFRMRAALRSELSARALLASHDYALDDFHALSWLMVHYLHAGRSAQGASRREQAVAYLGRLAAGEDWETAYAASFDVSLEELDAEIEAHGEQLRLGRVRLLHLDAAELDPRVVDGATALPASAAAADLGELLIAMERPVEAMRLLRAAIAGEPEDAVALATLAVAEFGAGWPEAGEASLARALALDGEDARILLQAGRVASRGGSPEALERGRHWYRRALEVDPGNAPAWKALGLSYEDAENALDLEAGVAALEGALVRSPADTALHLGLGRLRMRRGEADAARFHLRRVEQWSRREKERDEARSLLGELDDPAGD